MTRRLLFVHAHPDDEASKGAATAARYVDEGADVVLVTCTGGEAGEVLNPAYGDVADDEIARIRQLELRDAVAIIGFSRTHQLGYHDSGFHEDPAGVPEGSFARLAVDEAASALGRILLEERPHVIVTYPEDGGYPHPDHIMTYEVTMRAVELAGEAQTASELGADPWQVPRVFACTAFPRERVLALHKAMLDRALESPFEGWMERHAEHEDPGPPAARILTADWFERRDDALLAHATQVDPDGFWFQVPRDLEREVYPYEAFQLLHGELPVHEPVDDLFAGLDATS